MYLKVGNKEFQIDAQDYISLIPYKFRLLKGKGNNTDYVRCRYKGKEPTILLHRLLVNAKPGEIVDHINGDGLDNRIENLRIVSHQINAGNNKIRIDNTTGVKGCHFSKQHNKFMARIQINKVRYNLGSFSNLEDAKYAYEEAYYNHYGRFSR